MDDQTQRRMAENEAAFRDANERIEARAEELDFQQPIPFLCECGEPSCHEIVRLAFDQYAEVRRDPTRFFVLPSHESVAQAAGQVLDRRDGYSIVEKTGVAAEVAEQRNPRETAG
jgi:hypothetical protein